MDLVTIGESMVLFTPNQNGYMRHSHDFSLGIGGAESNVAIGLARLGHKTGWISRLGNDEFGKKILAVLKGEGVDTSRVQIDKSAPTGVLFKEVRTPNEIKVYYYRKGSAASYLSIENIDKEYLAKAKFLHITGITPALSNSCKKMIYEAIKVAHNKGLTVIFDPNLRTKLWNEKNARETLLEISSKVDIILPGIAEADFLFGEKDPERLGDMFLKLGPSIVVIKVGSKGAYYFTKEEQKFVPGFLVDKVVDPVGAGDGFAAGFISGLIDEIDLSKAVERGNAVGALVTMIRGDYEGLPEKEDIERFVSLNRDDIQR